jgi:hypothetical protein
LATIINASVSQGLVMTSDLSGVLTLQQNGVSLPNGGVAPAFSAYGSALQSFANTTYTKIAFNTEEFDTNNNYDSTTNYRFTPTVAGYYQINASCVFTANAAGRGFITIYKNGSVFKSGTRIPNSSNGPICGVSALISMNGTTDYLEIYGYQDSGGALNCGSADTTVTFSGCLVRGA